MTKPTPSPKWRLDTGTLNQNAAAIVEHLGAESVEVYNWLQARFVEPNGCEEPVFQFVFRSFYRLDNAGLISEFKRGYFRVLARQPKGSTPDVRAITLELAAFPTLRKEQTLQFSFATKLASTVNPTVAVYDAQVGHMYGFDTPSHHKPFDVRLDAFCEFHQFISEDYARIGKSGELDEALHVLEQAYGTRVANLTPTKRLDFLIWSAGKTLGA
jgi:hypothetical protein